MGYSPASTALALILFAARIVPRETPRERSQAVRRPAPDLLATRMLRLLSLVNMNMSASW